MGTNSTTPDWPWPCVMGSPGCVPIPGLPCARHKLVPGSPTPLTSELGRRGVLPAPTSWLGPWQLEKSLPCRLVWRVRAQASTPSAKEVSLPRLAGRNKVLRGQYSCLRAVSPGRQHLQLEGKDAQASCQMGRGSGGLPLKGTAAAIQGPTGSRAFLAGASSQLKVMSATSNLLPLNSQLPAATPHSLSASSLMSWLPLFSQQAPPPTWWLCGAPRARAWPHSRPT